MALPALPRFSGVIKQENINCPGEAYLYDCQYIKKSLASLCTRRAVVAEQSRLTLDVAESTNGAPQGKARRKVRFQWRL